MKALELIMDHDHRILREYGVRPTLRYVSPDVVKEFDGMIPSALKFATDSHNSICGIKVIVKHNFKGLLVMTPREFIPAL